LTERVDMSLCGDLPCQHGRETFWKSDELQFNEMLLRHNYLNKQHKFVDTS